MFCSTWDAAVTQAMPTAPKIEAAMMPPVTLTVPEMSVIVIIARWCPVIMRVTPAEPAHTA